MELRLMNPPETSKQDRITVMTMHLHVGVTWLEAPTLLRDLHWTPLEGPGICIIM